MTQGRVAVEGSAGRFTHDVKEKNNIDQTSPKGPYRSIELQWCHLSRRPQDRRVLREALHPYEVLTAAGFDVDLASETGTCAFDDISLTPPFLSGSEHAILNNPKHPFMVRIKSQLKKASDLKKEEYGLFFASAGHAALYD